MSGDVALTSALERIASGLERIAACLEKGKTLSEAEKVHEALKTIAKESVTVGHNQPVSPGPAASKPPSLTVETIRERLAKWLPDLEILDGFDGLIVKPKRYLVNSWAEVNDIVRMLGGHWMKGSSPKDGGWRIPK